MEPKLGSSALADSIPVMRAGMPADRLVVDTCSKIQSKLP